ncbi:MAG: hypothetical protein EBT57_07420 [Verrucomicrobia bacterium]|nr:hypothetical protein [Verrucomicrobiota bacterium]
MDNLGYYGWFNHRQSQGFRQANSQYALNNGNLTMALDADTKHRWYFKLNGYAECNGEPGGLRLNNNTVRTPVNYNVDRSASSRLHDEFQLNRYAASVVHESEFSDDLFFSYRAWFDYYRRWSRGSEPCPLSKRLSWKPSSFILGAWNRAGAGTGIWEVKLKRSRQA